MPAHNKNRAPRPGLASGVATLALLVLYAGVIVPAGIVMKLLGRDPLRRKPDARRASYWRQRGRGAPRMHRQR